MIDEVDHDVTQYKESKRNLVERINRPMRLFFFALVLSQFTPHQQLEVYAQDNVEQTIQEISTPMYTGPEVDTLLSPESQKKLFAASIHIHEELNNENNDFLWGSGYVAKNGDEVSVYTVNHVIEDEPGATVEIVLPEVSDQETPYFPFIFSHAKLTFHQPISILPNDFKQETKFTNEPLLKYTLSREQIAALPPELKPFSIEPIEPYLKKTEYFAVLAPQLLISANQEKRMYEGKSYVDPTLLKYTGFDQNDDAFTFLNVDGTPERTGSEETSICAGDSGSAIVPVELKDGKWEVLNNSHGEIPVVGSLASVSREDSQFRDQVRWIVCATENSKIEIATIKP